MQNAMEYNMCQQQVIASGVSWHYDHRALTVAIGQHSENV